MLVKAVVAVWVNWDTVPVNLAKLATGVGMITWVYYIF